jgi:hypothetical protein
VQVWEIIKDCWAHQPWLRPSIDDVLERLLEVQEKWGGGVPTTPASADVKVKKGLMGKLKKILS